MTRTTTARAPRQASAPTPAAPLPLPARREMEAAFGHDFSAVRVHTDERPGALGARALTEGSDIHVAPGAYAPGSAEGRRLLAHELAHVVQQAGRAPSGTAADRSGEHAAHEAADRVVAGGRVRVAGRAATGPQPDDGATPPSASTADDPVGVITGGLRTVSGELAKNEKVKKELVEPVTRAVGGRATREWGSLGGGEKAGLVGFGVGTVGLGAGALLSDPGGRRVLAGVNLAAPLGLLPYATLTTFSYSMPSGAAGGPQLWTFRTGFDLTDVLRLGGDLLGWKGLSLTADLTWDYDPATRSLTLAGGTGRLGLVPGLSVSGGTYPSLLPAPRLFPTDAGPGQQKQSLPEGPKAPGAPDVRVMVTFDLVAFARSGTVPGLAEAFGVAKRKK
ncbi:MULTISPECIES: eCIS core domain-containing protein [unclassified Isoptericola]|uniref:eCIS core domain-containing protein n=1 Tax=unclassified Isoptericola TaxID=2623355 RepID=UPI00364B72F2